MKIIGYILSIAGIVGLAYTMVPQIQPYIPFLKGISSTIITIISAALILVGLFIIVKGGRFRGRQAVEVPIYHGKNVVGYRRH
ncbi:hypothetical protein J4402_04970 [Candidatus Pacearchaeota archaeon]|nr:hypothetical protein [Candidatus Pacearchaeota archaeon]